MDISITAAPPADLHTTQPSAVPAGDAAKAPPIASQAAAQPSAALRGLQLTSSACAAETATPAQGAAAHAPAASAQAAEPMDADQPTPACPATGHSSLAPTAAASMDAAPQAGPHAEEQATAGGDGLASPRGAKPVRARPDGAFEVSSWNPFWRFLTTSSLQAATAARAALPMCVRSARQAAPPALLRAASALLHLHASLPACMAQPAQGLMHLTLRQALQQDPAIAQPRQLWTPSSQRKVDSVIPFSDRQPEAVVHAEPQEEGQVAQGPAPEGKARRRAGAGGPGAGG